MGNPNSSNGVVRFGLFEVDLRSGEIRKRGIRVRLQEQPFQVLAALIGRPGEVVTREELVRRLWADGTVVDYEGGLNAAVTRLRQALSDSAEAPRYIETVARRGYRWIAPVERGDDAQPGVAAASVPARSGEGRRRILLGLAAGATIVVAASALLALRPHGRAERAISIVPLTNGLGAERNASFSPDGTQIVYEWEREDHQRHIYIKEVGAGDPVALTSGNSAEYGPEWSPDGRLIAFLRANGVAELDLYVVAPLGGVERKVASLAAPQPVMLSRFVRRMAWTADSSHVVVSAPDRFSVGERLLLVSISDGAQRWLTNPKPDLITGDREPAVSPDGRQVAFARGELGAGETLWILPVTADLAPAGGARQLSAAGARSPAWSPDGREILCTGVSPGMAGSGLSKLPVAGGPAVAIPLAGATAATPAVSRTGRVAFARARVESSIWRQGVPAAGDAVPPPSRLTDAVAADGNAAYSPDGLRIVFGSNRSGTRNIWTCDSTGAHCQALTSFDASFATGSPQWSPDGRQIAFDSGVAGRMQIYVVDANGGAARRLTDEPTAGFVPRWSHDGAWIYFSSARSGTNEIWKIPSTGGTPVRVTRSGGFAVAEAPAADALYYTKTAEQADLFRSEVDGSGERLVLRGVTQRGFVVTKDLIYYLHSDPDKAVSIREFRLATGDDRQIARVVDPLFPGLALSPDGRDLIYTRMRVASNLTLAEGIFR